MADAPRRVTRGELLSLASDVVWRFRAYESYGEEPARAIRALKRRGPGFTDRQYRNAFDQALSLYDAVQELLRTKGDRVWAAYREKRAFHQVFDDELARRFPGFRKSTLGSVVGMSFYYWHLR